MSSVTAVILSYNSLRSLVRVIDAVKNQTCAVLDIILVDNASSDGTKEYIAETYDDLDFIPLPENCGVGAGHNRGWSRALENPQCDFIWSLEHDCVPRTDCLQGLVAAYEASVDSELIGAISPLQLPSEQLSAHRAYYWKGSRFARVVLPIDFEGPFWGRGFTFNGTLFPSRVIRAVGFLNPELFVGREDFEYSRRIVEAGYRILTVPNAIVLHDIYKSWQTISVVGRTIHFPGDSVMRSYYGTRNALYLVKHQRNPALLALKTLARFCISMLYIILSGDRKLRRIQARLFAVRDALRGDMGRKDYAFLEGHQ